MTETIFLGICAVILVLSLFIEIYILKNLFEFNEFSRQNKKSLDQDIERAYSMIDTLSTKLDITNKYISNLKKDLNLLQDRALEQQNHIDAIEFDLRSTTCQQNEKN